MMRLYLRPRRICNSFVLATVSPDIFSACIGFSANPASINAVERISASASRFWPIAKEIPTFVLGKYISGWISTFRPALINSLLNSLPKASVSGSPIMMNRDTVFPLRCFKPFANFALWSAPIRRGANLSSILNLASLSCSAMRLASEERSFALAISSPNPSASFFNRDISSSCAIVSAFWTATSFC